MSIVDVREEQALLKEAEAACLASIRSCSQASVGFVDFIEKMNLSPTHPRVQQIVKRIPRIFDSVVDASSDLAECHRIAQRLIDKSRLSVIQMDGGDDKEDERGGGEVPAGALRNIVAHPTFQAEPKEVSARA